MNISDNFNLPIIEKQKIRSEADAYGTSHFIANKLGLSSTPLSSASWLHGWRFQDVRTVGELILPFNIHLKRHLLAKEEHTVFLKNRGWKNVFTVGMPFVYFLEEKDLTDFSQKIPNSLLVMPPHSPKAADSAPEEQSYIDHVLKNIANDTFVCFCIHQDCESKGFWVKSLEKAKIPFVIGASLEDRNGISRMIQIYNHFEAMTTNTFGSHILQASLCNLKVSVSGPEHIVDPQSVINSSRWIYKKSDIQSFLNLCEGYSHEILRKTYPFLFCDIRDAKENLKWAIKESGFDKKVPLETLATLLGWNNSLATKLDHYTWRYSRLVKREIGYYLTRLASNRQ